MAYNNFGIWFPLRSVNLWLRCVMPFITFANVRTGQKKCCQRRKILVQLRRLNAADTALKHISTISLTATAKRLKMFLTVLPRVVAPRYKARGAARTHVVSAPDEMSNVSPTLVGKANAGQLNDRRDKFTTASRKRRVPLPPVPDFPQRRFDSCLASRSPDADGVIAGAMVISHQIRQWRVRPLSLYDCAAVVLVYSLAVTVFTLLF